MNQASSVLSDAAHSFIANLAGGKDAPDQQRSLKKSDRDWCYQFLGRAELGAATDDAPAAKGGLTPLATIYCPRGWPRFVWGPLSPSNPLQQHRAPMGDSNGETEWRDRLAGLPGWLVVGCGGFPPPAPQPSCPLGCPLALQ